TNTRFLSTALGFSAGVMIYISFTEILGKSMDLLRESYGMTTGSWYAILSFFGGIMVIAIIDSLVPSFENPHEIRRVEDIRIQDQNGQNKSLMRMGTFMALAIAMHNFPEGLATFAAGMADPTLGISIAVAIAIHNIPEGIAVSVPVYYATGNKRRAFFLSFASGLAEPIGGLLGWLFLTSFLNESTLGILFGGVAGIMVFISVDELLPTAREYGHHHHAIYGLIGGMAVMAVSLLLFL
ncbi:MAG: zinc transporter ZupT, partial [Bacteroidales bacterium]|nr:zinc transporter ZupT [Bacteroidales bacterium]